MQKTLKTLVISLTGILFTGTVSADLLFMDNFNVSDSSSFDAADLTGRRSGSLANDTYLRSFGAQQQINNNQLLLPTGTNGVRFEDATNDGGGTFGQTDRYDWANGTAGSTILAHGGFTVEFDWIPPENTLGDWVSFQVGTINDDNGNLTDDDYGILFRNSGGIERWDNSANLGPGISFGASAGGINRHIKIVYSFNSFADGATVGVVSSVDGFEVANDSFTWDANGGALRMELGHNAADTRVDNLMVYTVPEPSALTLLGLGIIGLLRRRA